MEDLLKLNRSIVEHWLGKIDAQQEEYLSFTPICLGLLPHTAEVLSRAITQIRRSPNPRLRVSSLNKHYLDYARLAAKDAAAGKIEMLVAMGLSIDQARILGSLTTDELAMLAVAWEGPIIEFTGKSFLHGASMRSGAARHHAAALVATSE